MPPRPSHEIEKGKLFEGRVVTPHLYVSQTSKCQVLKLEVDTQSAEKKASILKVLQDELENIVKDAFIEILGFDDNIVSFFGSIFSYNSPYIAAGGSSLISPQTIINSSFSFFIS